MMKLGLENLIEKEISLIKGKRIGLMCHKASVDAKGRHAISLIKERFNLIALFAPEHGIESKAQDMEAVGDESKGVIPVYSLYGETFSSLSPTDKQLSKIDTLIVDLQDIGSRYYTYIWTMTLAMKTCAKAGKTVIVCDRPNPINGVDMEGALQENGFESFVGLYPLPVRHAMTIGEIAGYINEEYELGCNLHVVKMEGWRRDSFWPDTNLVWVNPSPNMRSFNSALLYPGMCLIEGTNLSEGRGTETPFEVVGAPYINSDELIAGLGELNLAGIRAEKTSFTPTRQKWAGEICNGARWFVIDKRVVKPYFAGLAFIWLVNKLYKGKGFGWRKEPYEFVSDKSAIDLLTGSSFFRENINGDFSSLTRLSTPLQEFLEKRRQFLLY